MALLVGLVAASADLVCGRPLGGSINMTTIITTRQLGVYHG